MMSNDYIGFNGDQIGSDEEVNCVFCGKLFPSIEKVQDHISQFHDSTEGNSEVIEIKQEPVWETKQIKVYDQNSEPVSNRSIDFSTTVPCPKCGLLFANSYASRMHYDKVHALKKRKRSSNPNGVEGIIISPNGSDNWGCDICGRQFPTLKQAKVHKFKSHIEPVQKRKLLIHRNIIRKSSNSQRNLVKRYLTENKFREILPNSKLCINPCDYICQINNDENGSHGGDNNIDYRLVGRPEAGLWRAAQAGSLGNKIVISRVYALVNQNDKSFADSQNRYGFLHRRGYRCFFCNSIFLNRPNFTRHLILHRKKNTFKCHQCGVKFPRIKMLKQHQRENCVTVRVKVNLKAGINMKCDTRVSTSCDSVANESPGTLVETLVKQNQNNAEDDLLTTRNLKFAEKFLGNPAIILNKGSQCVCNLCQSCFYSNNSILRHLILYHRIAIQDGSTPLFVVKQESTVAKPKSSGIDQPQDLSSQAPKPSLHFIHNCDHCGSQFASKKGLQRHLQSVHMSQSFESLSKDGRVEFSRKATDNNSQKWLCSDCNATFDDESMFAVHRDECSGWTSSPGGGSRRVKCDVCRRRFRNPLTLEEHRRMHEIEYSSNVMDTCDVSSRELFAQVDKIAGGTVNYNISSAADDGRPRPGGNATFSGGPAKKASRPYAIPAYKKAKVPPNAEGLFECDVCHKAFTCRSSLSNHVKSHFNFKNKPFSCSSCKQGFMSTLTLQHHREQLCPNLHRQTESAEPVVGHDNVTSPSNGGFSSFDGLFSAGVTTSNYSATPATNDQGNNSMYGGANANSLTTRATSCMHCSAMFPDRSLLEDHASKEHSNHAGEVVCIICPRSFTTYMAFRVHMTKSHGGPNGTSLKSHLNSSGIQKANTSFEMIQELSTILSSKEHQNSPSTSPNGIVCSIRHACPNCDKDFSTSQALGNHKRACMPHLYKKVSM